MKKNIINFLKVVEFRTKTVSITTLLTASFYVWWRFRFPPLDAFFLMWFASLAVDMGTTAFNNYYDFLQGIDKNRDSSEPDKIIVHGNVSPAFAFWSAFFCYAVAIVLGLIIGIHINFWVIPLGCISMLAGFLYTGGPFPIARTPFGELFAGGFLGLVLFAIANLVWAGIVDIKTLVAGIPFSCIIASILMVNNTCDIEGDMQAGRKTLAIVCGRKWARIFTLMYIVLAYVFVLFAYFFGAVSKFHVLTTGVSLGYVLPLWFRMHKCGYSHITKGYNMHSILKILIGFTIAYNAGFLIDMLI